MKLAFDCTLQTHPNALVVVWRITNHEPFDVGLFNRIPYVLADGTYRISPDTAWVELDPEHGLYVRKSALPVPPGLHVHAYIPPLCSRVRPGASYDESVQLPLPLPEMQPFKRALQSGRARGEAVADQPATATRLTFEIGVFPVASGVRLAPEHPAFPEVLTAKTHHAVALQELLTRTFDLGVLVRALTYRVAPWP